MTKDHKTFRKFLTLLEERSTCKRVSVGAALVRDGRVLSTGWNGVPSGHEHCEDIDPNNHKEFSSNNEIHAEANCLGYAARNGVATEGADLYTSVAPCRYCAKQIEASGVSRVFYKRRYDRSDEGLRFLSKCGIETKQI